MKTIIINKNDSGQRLDKFLGKCLKRLPSALMYKYIRKKRIKINNKKCDISYKLKEGDILNLYINDEFFIENKSDLDFLKAPPNLNIIYQDDNIMIIDKKPGLIVHPDENIEIDCLINRIKNYLYIKKEYIIENSNSFSPSLVNRIDRNTGGIVIAAKNSESLRVLNKKMKNREIKKFYLCIVHGQMPKKQDILIGYLKKDEQTNCVEILSYSKPGYKKIITKYSVLKQTKYSSLLEVELLTGRTHQIRAHLAFIGHPILGDGKYCPNSLNKTTNYPYQALYSYKIKFNFSSENTILDYLNNKTFIANNIWFINDNP